jgi:CHAT domain-containing protein
MNSSNTDTKTKVYISPSGLLHKISFPAIAKEQDIYLCDAYDIEIKSTTGKIASGGAVETIYESSRPTTATIFGGINYDTDSTSYQGWTYLEGTKTETQKIDKILKKGKVEVSYFTNTNATEGEFKQLASNSNILHIATHGFFYPDPKDVVLESDTMEVVEDITFRGGSRGFGVNSFVENYNPLMRSGLVFAGANDVWSKQNKTDSIDDGVLTAQEVSNIDMRKTDLVVMSACETGLGDIKGSEGVYGLQRAFKMAGVNYMIMSLWQVPDKETEEFMTKFYKKLIKKNNIKQAFAETQKEMRKKYDPYFWAAFVLVE